MSAGGSLRSPGGDIVNYKGDNISKYVHLSVLKSISLEKSPNLPILKFLMRNDDDITK